MHVYLHRKSRIPGDKLPSSLLGTFHIQDTFVSLGDVRGDKPSRSLLALWTQESNIIEESVFNNCETITEQEQLLS